MNFQVPQFVEIEDKIFGPLTIKQFVYLAGGLGLSFSVYYFLPKFLSFVLIPIIMVFAASLSFYRPNDRPFVYFLEAGFRYLAGNKLYVWQKRRNENKKKEEKKEEDVVSEINIPRLSDSKLSDLSWSLDIKEKLFDDVEQK